MSSIRGILVTWLLGFTLVGCATFHNRPISPQHTLTAFEARRLDSAETHHAVEASLKNNVGPWPPQRWSLALLTPVALHYSAVLAAAEARAHAAKAKIQVAKQRPDPQFGFEPGYNTNSTGGESPWIFEYLLSFPFATSDRRLAVIHQAGALSKAVGFDVATAAWLVRSQLRLSLLNLYITQRRSRLLGRQEVAEGKVLRLLRARPGASEGHQAALFETQSAYQSIQYDLAQAQTEERLARDTLAAALSLPARALQDVAFAFVDFRVTLPPAPTLAVRRAALINRPDIRAALARYAASQFALQRQIDRQYPALLSIGPGYTWDQGQDKWSLGIAISLPILNHNQAKVKAAQARRREAAAQFEIVQDRVIAEVTQATAAYRGARDSLSLATQAAHSAEQGAQAAAAQFKLGEIDGFPLAFASQTARRSELVHLNAVINAQTALNQMENVLQEPLNHSAYAPQVAPPKKH